MNSTKDNCQDRAEIVVRCADFEATFKYFTEQLKFNLYSIFPADDPKTASIFGYGLNIRLEKTKKLAENNRDIEIRICSDSLGEEFSKLTPPDGIKLSFAQEGSNFPRTEYESRLIINKFSENADWVTGRADMRYRDLIPGREGGRFIASHIHIEKGGIVPDYVHFHNIYFQMIYCYKGWAKLVYQDQGEPFILNAGDCVLQPPKIRHRVLESSDNLEVIEFSSPAEHETFAEHKITLPTEKKDKKREFSGQRFVHHISAKAVSEDWQRDGFMCRNTGIDVATKGLASVKIISLKDSLDNTKLITSNDTFNFFFILKGETEFRQDEFSERLGAGDSLVIPSNQEYHFANCSDDLEFLEVLVKREESI